MGSVGNLVLFAAVKGFWKSNKLWLGWHLFDSECRILGLSRGVVCVIRRLAVLIQYRRVPDTHTNTRQQHIPR